MAIDIGNSRIKLAGYYAGSASARSGTDNFVAEGPGKGARPTPPARWLWRQTWDLQSHLDRAHALTALQDLASQFPGEIISWRVASVNHEFADELVNLIGIHRPADRIERIGASHFCIEHRMEAPERTGVDRWCAIAGALMLNLHVDSAGSARRLVVIDVGTAVTIELVGPGQVYEGGVIFLGPAKCLQQLNSQTSALPRLDFQSAPDLPNVVSTNTIDSIYAGTVYSLVGALKEISTRLAPEDGGKAEAQVVITGGAVAKILQHLPAHWIHVEDLVLRGIQSIKLRD